MKKKLFAMISLTLTASIALTGCIGNGGNQSSSTGGSAASDSAGGSDTAGDAADDSAGGSGDHLIGMVVNNGGQDPYQTAYYNTIKDKAKEMNINLQLLDPVGDATTQANQVQDLINMKCDAIIIWPVNSETGVASARAVQKAGIPCMTANTNVSADGEEFIQCYVGPSNVEEGKQTAEAMLENIGEDAKIVEITGPAGYSTSLERSQGMKEAIEGTNIEVLDSQTGEGNREKCQQVMENYLVKYGKGEIDAVYTFDDNAAYGAWNAIEAAGRQDDVKIFAAASGSYGTIRFRPQLCSPPTLTQNPHWRWLLSWQTEKNRKNSTIT